MHLAYSPDLNHNTIQLDKDESLHVNKVLRLDLGDEINLTDGKGSLAKGRISSSGKKNISIDITDISTRECPYTLELAIAPTKGNDRFELILEKCTELGIRKIHPIICHHSERRKLNLDRCNRILISAIKQSQKSWLPEISEPLKFESLISSSSQKTRLIAHCNSDISRVSLKQAILTSESTLICIGPEGDFSANEIKLSEATGFKSIHLGEERLRTETAAIFVTSAFKTIMS